MLCRRSLRPSCKDRLAMSDDIKPLNTREASQYLLDKWRYKISPHTLDTYRSRGGGPENFYIGVNALYSPADLDAWVMARMTPKVGSASEARQIRLDALGAMAQRKDKSEPRNSDHSKSEPHTKTTSKSKPNTPNIS
jgi:hypothetical protein